MLLIGVFDIIRKLFLIRKLPCDHVQTTRSGSSRRSPDVANEQILVRVWAWRCASVDQVSVIELYTSSPFTEFSFRTDFSTDLERLTKEIDIESITFSINWWSVPRSNMTGRKWSFTDRKRLSDEEPSTLRNWSTKNGVLRGLLGPFTDQITDTRATGRKGCPFTSRFKQFFNGTLVKSPEEENCIHRYSSSFLTWSGWSKCLKITFQVKHGGTYEATNG